MAARNIDQLPCGNAFQYLYELLLSAANSESRWVIERCKMLSVQELHCRTKDLPPKRTQPYFTHLSRAKHQSAPRFPCCEVSTRSWRRSVRDSRERKDESLASLHASVIHLRACSFSVPCFCVGSTGNRKDSHPVVPLLRHSHLINPLMFNRRYFINLGNGF